VRATSLSKIQSNIHPHLNPPPSRGRRIVTKIALLDFGKLAITEKDGFPFSWE